MSIDLSKRSSGILMHITSLPGKYGLGTLGTEAYDYINFLHKTRQSLWQILPLGHTGYGDSPYQCFSAFAGNPLLICTDMLFEQGLLERKDYKADMHFEDTEFDILKVWHFKMPLLYKAAATFHKKSEGKEKFDAFCKHNKSWLNDYALFLVLKEKFDARPWFDWEEPFKMCDRETLRKSRLKFKRKILHVKTIQYFFFNQWEALKQYAHSKGVFIFGDIPLYVAYDSADVWRHPQLFQLDKKKKPIAVAGVPPDYFSETGQLWGNPLYKWEHHFETGFQWWISRLKASFELYDILRIDHFRGLHSYWSVPFEEDTAVNGEWRQAKGAELLEKVMSTLGEVPIVAEDLGIITEEVLALKRRWQFPGMKVLQFAFDKDSSNPFLPHNYNKSCVVYTGTHDNDTTKGWYIEGKNLNKQLLDTYLNFDPAEVSWELVRLAWMSVANIAIAPMQDILQLDSQARMNKPGEATGYWKWRMKKGGITTQLEEKLKTLTEIYGRSAKF